MNWLTRVMVVVVVGYCTALPNSLYHRPAQPLAQALQAVDDARRRDNDFGYLMPESGEESDMLSVLLFDRQQDSLESNVGHYHETPGRERRHGRRRGRVRGRKERKRGSKERKHGSKERKRDSKERKHGSKERKHGSKERKHGSKEKKKKKKCHGSREHGRGRSRECDLTTSTSSTTTVTTTTTTPSTVATTTPTTTTPGDTQPATTPSSDDDEDTTDDVSRELTFSPEFLPDDNEPFPFNEAEFLEEPFYY